jgi:hypothetical protein
MSPRRLTLLSLLLLLAYANQASADKAPHAHAVTNGSAKDLDQIVYKGLVGNALDGIPMDPSRRVSLQRTNAIISNTLSGRSLAALAGLTNPVLLLGGLAWGVWSASNIKPEDDAVQASLDAGPSANAKVFEGNPISLLDKSSAATLAAVEPVESPGVRPPVVKVWLPQRGAAEQGKR